MWCSKVCHRPDGLEVMLVAMCDTNCRFAIAQIVLEVLRGSEVTTTIVCHRPDGLEAFATTTHVLMAHPWFAIAQNRLEDISGKLN